MKKHLILTLFLGCWSMIMLAQQEYHYFRTLDTDGGLPHNFIIDLLEDADGLMWISTPGGLTKYNGQTFINYVPHIRDSTIKKDRLPFIWDIFEDSRGQLWLGADNGIFLFDKKTGKADCLTSFGKADFNCEDISAYSIYESPQGFFYISTEKGVLQINWQDSTTILYPHPNYNFNATLLEDSLGQIWSASFNGMYLLQADTTLAYFTFPNSAGITPDLFCFHIDQKQQFWIGTSEGLYRFYPNKKRFKSIEIPGFEKIVVSKIVAAADGKLYLGSHDDGLLYWDAATGEVIDHYQFSIDANGGLASNYLYTIAQSRGNSLWLGTNEGISIFKPSNQQFRLFSAPGEKRNPSNSHPFLFIDSQDGIWFYRYAGNNFFRQKEINIHPEPAHWSTPLSNSLIFKFWEDPQRNIWLSSGAQGLFRAPFQTLNFDLVKNLTYFGGFSTKQIVSDPTDKASFWIATNGGLCHFNSSTYDTSWVRPTFLDSNANEDFISRLVSQEDGSLWFMNSNRLCSYNPTTKNFACYALEQTNSGQKIDIGYVSNLQWSGDHLYIAARNGFIIFDYSNQSFVLLEEDQGNDLRNISSLIIDNQGMVWLARDNQLVKYNPRKEAFFFFDIKRFCSEFILSTVTKRSDGRLIFGTKCGMLLVDPMVETTSSIPPNVVLSNFRVRNQDYELGGSPEFIESIELPYQDNFFTIDYTALEYLHPENINYHYKLEGLNEEWVNVGNDRSVNFANLAPGNYTFLAEATMPDGTRSISPLRLPIRIQPAYWQTLWFKVLIAIIFLAIALAILRARQKALQLEADKRLAEQNSLYKSKFLANVSHEIRTPLNAILGINSLLMESELNQKQHHFTESIHLSCEKLLAIINDLLDQAKIESGKFSLNPQPFELRQLVQQIERLLAHKFTEKSLILQTNIDPNVPPVLVGDAIRLFQILMNLAGNALKFTQQGQVTITINAHSDDQTNYLLHFAVADTGVGIPAEKLADVFKSFEQLDNQPTSSREQGTGLGLSIAKELVELQGGQIEVHSEVNQGTTFRFNLPLLLGEEKIIATKARSESTLPTGLKILIVDDTPINQFLTAELLKKHLPDVQTEVAANGEVALEKVSREQYDMILMDVRMPVMGGIEATQQIRHKTEAYFKTVPILGLTSDAIPQQIEACLKAGMNACLSKPVRTEELVAAIRQNIIKA